MPYPYAPEPYISRPQAEDLVDFFGVALTQPQDHPLVFNISGMAGTGKTTLLKHLIKKFGGRAEIIEFSFRETIQGLTTEVYLDLMHHLYEQIPVSLRKKTDRQPNSFMRLYDQYCSTVQKLINQSPDNKAPISEEKSKETKQLLKAAARVLPMAASLSSGIGPIATGIGAVAKMATDQNIDATVDTVAAFLTGKERLDQLLQQHHVTKKDQSLQQLMRAPEQRLTKAFVEDLIAQASDKPIIICFDTFEKAPLEINQWLRQFLLGQSQLQKHCIRIVVAGQQCLTQNEEWRKLQQDFDLIFEKTIERFSDEETHAYLQKIHWADTDDIQKILQITGGLPYYLNWIRKKFQKGEEIDLSQGNQAISDLLFQGISQEQRIVVQLVACCRWFERTLIRELIRQEDLLDGIAISEDVDWFEWLKPQHFVQQVQGKYQFDDVARDVFQTLLQQENEKHFRNTHLALAKHYHNRADQIVTPGSSETARYNNPDWCVAITEYLYHLLLSEQADRHAQFINHLFASYYLKAPEVSTNTLIAISSAENLPTNSTKKWIQEDIKILITGIYFCEILPFLTEHNNSQTNDQVPRDELEIALKRLGTNLQEIWSQAFDSYPQYLDKVDGLGKYAYFLYRSHLAPRDQLSCLMKAKDEIEKLSDNNSKSFISSLFFELSSKYFGLGHHDEAIESIEKSIEYKSDDGLAWCNYGVILSHLHRDKEAIESYEKAIFYSSDLIKNKADFWFNYGESLARLNKYEEAIIKYNQATVIEPTDFQAWCKRGMALESLKRYDDAISSYSKALGFNPSNDQVWNILGMELEQLGRYEAAIASYDKALQSQSDNLQAWFSRGVALSNLGRFEDAITSWDKALDLKPDDGDIWGLRGVAFTNLRQFNHAITSYDKALEINPEDPSTFYNKACCYALQANTEEAIEHFKIAISFAPDECREMAKTDPAFDLIRDNEAFQALLKS